MDKWLAQNLEQIPGHLKKGWDVVAIVSGSGLVRVGKSTLAMQMAAFVDWCIAGGKMIWGEDGKVKGVVPPKKPLRFGLDNVVFSPEDLIKVTKEKGVDQKFNVFVLDEGREGLLGARVMESVNKKFEDYFQTCGVYNNFIIIVLPDFFKLAEQYCVNRSTFLINTFHKNYERGYFSFFNTLQKERLYFFGKKRLGISARYSSSSRNFWGRFSRWLPFDETKYNNKKKAAIGKEKWSKYDVAQMKQRDLLSYLVYKNTDFTINDIAESMQELGAPEYTKGLVERSLRNAKRILENQKFVVDEDEEPDQVPDQDVEFDNLDEGEIEKVKNPNVGAAGYNKVYENTDITTEKFTKGVIIENDEKKDRDEDTPRPERAEIVTADDSYGDDGITEAKYKLPDRKQRDFLKNQPVNPDKQLFPGDAAKEIVDLEKQKEEFEDLDKKVLEILGEAEKQPVKLTKYKKRTEKVSDSEEVAEEVPDSEKDFKEEFNKLQKD